MYYGLGTYFFMLLPGFVAACLRFLLLCLYGACMSVAFDGCVTTVIFLLVALRLPNDRPQGDGGGRGRVECPCLVYVRWRCFAIFMGWGRLCGVFRGTCGRVSFMSDVFLCYFVGVDRP